MPTYIYEASTERIELIIVEHDTQICETIIVQREQEGAIVSAEISGGIFKESVNILTRSNTKVIEDKAFVNISNIRLENFIREIYSCYILDWHEEYINTHIVLDKDWWLKIHFSDGTNMERMGSAGYPPHWKKFWKKIQELKNHLE